mmetsp:Transcript_17718/g.40884  ORF Transcript_17718/g.40884 Transcript_17718/m.40884 type:complete len:156 (-) Transcript_17718:1602-2069(-)
MEDGIVGDKVDEEFGGIVGDKVGDVESGKVDDEIGGTVGNIVGSIVGGTVDDMVGSMVGNIVGDDVGDEVCNVGGDNVGDIVEISLLVRIVGAKVVITGIAVGDNVGITIVTDSLVVTNIEGALEPAVLLPAVGVAVGTLVGGCIDAASVGASVF